MVQRLPPCYVRRRAPYLRASSAAFSVCEKPQSAEAAEAILSGCPRQWSTGQCDFFRRFPRLTIVPRNVKVKRDHFTNIVQGVDGRWVLPAGRLLRKAIGQGAKQIGTRYRSKRYIMGSRCRAPNGMRSIDGCNPEDLCCRLTLRRSSQGSITWS